jgi:hypothetical protein
MNFCMVLKGVNTNSSKNSLDSLCVANINSIKPKGACNMPISDNGSRKEFFREYYLANKEKYKEQNKKTKELHKQRMGQKILDAKGCYYCGENEKVCLFVRKNKDKNVCCLNCDAKIKGGDILFPH